ncbi:MAG: hypothetical protein ACK4RV_05580 [Caulobacter sp.]
MAWEVLLIESDNSPSAEDYEAVADSGLQRIGATGSIASGDAHTRDGFYLNFDTHGGQGGMFRLREFSPGIAEAIFVIAEDTQSFIVNTTGGAIYRTPGNTDIATGEEFNATAVASPAELERLLQAGYESASAYSQQVQQIPSGEPDPPSPLRRLFGVLFGKAP